MTIPNAISAVKNAMRENPSCLAALLMAAMFSTYVYLSLREERREMHERQLRLIDRCTDDRTP
jgi:hypothetical protein